MSLPSPTEYYQRFKNDPETAKRTAYQQGQEWGKKLKASENIQGGTLESVAQMLNTTMRFVKGDQDARVQGNTVIMTNNGFCAIMRAAMTLGIPWEWFDTNYAWPWLEGIVSTVRPNMKLKIVAARSRGDNSCVHVFET